MMTTTEIELMIAQWGNDPSPPLPRNPWERPRDPSGQQAAIKPALKHRPDLGWAFAQRCAASRRHCPVLKRPEFRWIRAACKLLTGDAAASRHLRDVAVVAQAIDIVKKSKVEGASDSYDPGSLGDFATAARSILMQDMQAIRDGIEQQISLAGQ